MPSFLEDLADSTVVVREHVGVVRVLDLATKLLELGLVPAWAAERRQVQPREDWLHDGWVGVVRCHQILRRRSFISFGRPCFRAHGHPLTVKMNWPPGLRTRLISLRAYEHRPCQSTESLHQSRLLSQTHLEAITRVEEGVHAYCDFVSIIHSVYQPCSC